MCRYDFYILDFPLIAENIHRTKGTDLKEDFATQNTSSSSHQSEEQQPSSLSLTVHSHLSLGAFPYDYFRKIVKCAPLPQSNGFSK